MSSDEKLYVSADIETTGLEPDENQVLQLAATTFDPDGPMNESFETINILINHEVVSGNPIAMGMNAEILTLIGKLSDLEAKQTKAMLKDDNATAEDLAVEITNIKLDNGIDYFCSPEMVGPYFAEWLKFRGWNGVDKVNATGKNFAGFDRPFLYKIPGFTDAVKFRHRTYDPGTLYREPGDLELPDTKLCIERADIETQIAELPFYEHHAVYDACVVALLVKKHNNRLAELYASINT